jgi:hypothetical protein
MAGIITKDDEQHPDHPVYKAREKARAVEAAKSAADEKAAVTKTETPTPKK